MLARARKESECYTMSNIGCRIYNKIERLPDELINQFKDIPVANLSDNMGRIACIDTAIRPLNKVRLIGSALTVKVAPNDNLFFHKAIDMAQPGDVIVVDGEGSTSHSLCGEIMYRYAMSRGIRGFIIDGVVRDCESLDELPFAVYARGVQPKGPYKNGPGEINVPVAIGGIVVEPGDLVLGDRDGVVVIKKADAHEMLEKGKVHNAMEVKTFEDIAAGRLNRDWVDQTLAKINCEIIE